MRTVGLLGGMGWQSTRLYYQTLNECVAQTLGGHHSARVLLHSVDFHDIVSLQRLDRWDEAGQILVDAARSLETAGASFLLICCNTMHTAAPQIEAGTGIPLLHIADATGDALASAGVRRIGLLGTRATMEGSFYRSRLQERCGLEILLPAKDDGEQVDRIIYEELCVSRVEPDSRTTCRRLISEFAEGGAEAVVLGCTELALLLDESASSLPLYDTARIHAKHAARIALGELPLPD